MISKISPGLTSNDEYFSYSRHVLRWYAAQENKKQPFYQLKIPFALTEGHLIEMKVTEGQWRLEFQTRVLVLPHSDPIWQGLNGILKNPFLHLLKDFGKSHTWWLFLTSACFSLSSQLSSLCRILMYKYTGIIWEHLSLRIVCSIFSHFSFVHYRIQLLWK